MRNKTTKNDKWEQWKEKIQEDELDVPMLRRIPSTKKPMSLPDKITWVLTAVNVAILISLLIRNI